MTRTHAHALLLFCTIGIAGCGGCNGDKAPPPPSVTPTAAAEQAAPPPAAATAPAAAAPEVDCFVIVDAETDFGAPPLTVQFTTETDCTGSPVTFSWDFGDGTKGGNEANPTHVYEKVGDFIASVTATAPDGGTGEDEIDITVDTDLAE